MSYDNPIILLKLKIVERFDQYPGNFVIPVLFNSNEMKKLLLSVAIITIVASGISRAQNTVPVLPSDTLVVLWSSGDPEVAEKACLMYTQAAKRFNWFNEVILVVWGPSEKLLAENESIREKINEMQKDGIKVEACIACSNMYGVTGELKACSVDVKGMGGTLSNYLKKGYSIVSF